MTNDQVFAAEVAARRALGDNTFAEACYNDNTISDLRESLAGPADSVDMREWDLTETEWREQIALAIAALEAKAAADAVE